MLRADKVLTRDEVAGVLRYLDCWAPVRESERLNRVIFRLAAGCGMRCLEIRGLRMRDVFTDVATPVIEIPAGITKGREGKRRARAIPLTWDRGTHDDIHEWLQWRQTVGARPLDPFVCGMRRDYFGLRIGKQTIARRWRGLMRRALGPHRARQLGIHCGRRTFCTHALHVGHALPDVRDAAGHTSLQVTCLYVGVLSRDGVPDMFDFREPAVIPISAGRRPASEKSFSDSIDWLAWVG